TRMGYGGKLGIDATAKWASEGRDPEAERAALRERAVDPAALAAKLQQLGASNHRLVTDAGIVIVSIDKHRGGQGTELLEQLRDAPEAAGLKLAMVFDSYVDVDDLAEVAFRAFGNTDPVRDSVRA